MHQDSLHVDPARRALKAALIVLASLSLAGKLRAQTLISTGTTSGVRLYTNPNSNDWWLDPTPGRLDLRPNGLTAIVSWIINGNVGIGTTGPAAKLDTSGSARFYDQTPTTGVTNLEIRAGAAVLTGSSQLFTVKNNAGVAQVFVDGLFQVNAAQFQDSAANAVFSLTDAGVGLSFRNTAHITWSSDATFFGAQDIGLYRYAPGVLEIFDGTNSANIRDLQVRALNPSSGSLRLSRSGDTNGYVLQNYNSGTALNIGYMANADDVTWYGGAPLMTMLFSGYVGISTGIPQGYLDMGNHTIVGVAAPVNGTDAANKAYVDAASAGVQYMGLTPTTYNGNLGGVPGANAKCDAAFHGSHFCTTTDIIHTSTPTFSAGWVNPVIHVMFDETSTLASTNAIYVYDVNFQNLIYGGSYVSVPLTWNEVTAAGWTDSGGGLFGCVLSGHAVAANTVADNNVESLHCCK